MSCDSSSPPVEDFRSHPMTFYLSQTSGLHVALLEPEIPPNTGNIARLCGATFTPLHLVGKLGFRVDEKAVRRAGLDYWDDVEIHYPRDLDALGQSLPEHRFLYFSTKAERLYTEWEYRPNDCLVFGRETRGLPEELLRANWERCLRIPMPNLAVRSLNLATSVGIVLYEALRQLSRTPSPCPESGTKIFLAPNPPK
jgi:tRNA (cytidine/uridine-2'-O-)-methyltransferase